MTYLLVISRGAASWYDHHDTGEGKQQQNNDAQKYGRKEPEVQFICWLWNTGRYIAKQKNGE